MDQELKVHAPLDPGFLPCSIFVREYEKEVEKAGKHEDFWISLKRPDGAVSVCKTRILPHLGKAKGLNLKYTERLLKTLLWVRGGYEVKIAGNRDIVNKLKNIYSAHGERSFDNDFMGKRIYGREFRLEHIAFQDFPEERETKERIGGHLEGTRVGFDLGGSDRKGALVKDGEVAFTEEVPWDPYFQKDPDWHRREILDTIERCRMKVPSIDAVGGSAAGVYVQNEVRVASIFRGVGGELFEKKVRNLFKDIGRELGVPLMVMNDGDVTALAGSMEIGRGCVLGISMGTSQAGGYVDENGGIKGWLNELAFVPVDLREGARKDGGSGDNGCGVQYFSQQAVARLARAAGITFEGDVPDPEKLKIVQELADGGDPAAMKVFETVGVYLGYALGYYSLFYDIETVMVLGRVTSGSAGDTIKSKAKEVMEKEFPELNERIGFHVPVEKWRRHGQAIAAASLVPPAGRPGEKGG